MPHTITLVSLDLNCFILKALVDHNKTKARIDLPRDIEDDLTSFLFMIWSFIFYAF